MQKKQKVNNNFIYILILLGLLLLSLLGVLMLLDKESNKYNIEKTEASKVFVKEAQNYFDTTKTFEGLTVKEVLYTKGEYYKIRYRGSESKTIHEFWLEKEILNEKTTKAEQQKLEKATEREKEYKEVYKYLLILVSAASVVIIVFIITIKIITRVKVYKMKRLVVKRLKANEIKLEKQQKRLKLKEKRLKQRGNKNNKNLTSD